MPRSVIRIDVARQLAARDVVEPESARKQSSLTRFVLPSEHRADLDASKPDACLILGLSLPPMRQHAVFVGGAVSGWRG